MKILFTGLLWLLMSSTQAQVAPQIQIESAFARAAIQQQRNSAIFMTLHNSGESAHITHATSPVADIVELHTHINDNGVMRMRKIPHIDLPAAGTVVLKPGGLHVMLLGLKQNLKEGDSISATLGFSDNSEKTIMVPVKMMNMQHMGKKKGHHINSGKPAMMRH